MIVRPQVPERAGLLSRPKGPRSAPEAGLTRVRVYSAGLNTGCVASAMVHASSGVPVERASQLGDEAADLSAAGIRIGST